MVDLVCNEEVTINYNNKLKTFKNYLLTNFLEKFVDNNFGVENNLSMTVIYGVFDYAPGLITVPWDINIDENLYIEAPDFDNLDRIVPLNAYKDGLNIKVVNTTMSSQKEENKISYVYRYKLYDFDNTKIRQQNSAYIGKEIKYLLFGTPSEIYAILDVRDENIIYSMNENNIDIFRKDIIRTKGLFHSKDLKYPYHLLCVPEKINNELVTSEICSVGLGYKSNKMNEEIPINELRVKTYKNNIYIQTDYTEVDTRNSIFPQRYRQPRYNKYPMVHNIHITENNDTTIPDNYLYSADSLFPLEYKYELRNSSIKKKLEHPSNKQPLTRRYPLRSIGNYKYIMIKYKLKNISRNEDINKFYILAYPLNLKNKIKINISYERGE